ncbi:MAG: hypothetical protein AAFU85_05670 [Planctomycetota bacterium]
MMVRHPLTDLNRHSQQRALSPASRMPSKAVIALRGRGTVELQELSDRLQEQSARMPESEERREVMRCQSLIISELLRRSENRRTRRRAC